MGELFKATAGIDLLHVPFKGEIDGVNALLGGTVDMMFTSAPTAAPQVRAGKLKGLAVTTARRDPAVPNLPSVVEAGQPELTTELFFGMLAPAGTPVPVIAKLAAALRIAVADPGYAQTMEKVRALGRQQHTGRVRGTAQGPQRPLDRDHQAQQPERGLNLA